MPSDSAASPRVAAALAGQLHYDALTADEQAVVRDIWERDLDERVDSLDLAAEFDAEGRSWVELNEHGGIERVPDPSDRPDGVN